MRPVLLSRERRAEEPARYYLMSLDGKHKKEIGTRPLGKDEISYIAWKDRTHVIWLENTNRRIELMEYSVQSGVRRPLVSSVWNAKDRKAVKFPASIKRWMDRCSPDAKGGKAKVVGNAPKYSIQLGGKTLPLDNPQATWKVSYGADGLDEYSLSVDPVVPLGLEDRGDSKERRLYGAYVGLTAHEGLYHLFRVNAKQGQASIIPADVVSVDARPGRDLWIGVSDRCLSGDIWSNALSVGKISSGLPKKVLTGRVWISGFSLRP